MATVENPYEKVRRKMVTARIEFMGQLAKFGNDELTKQPAEGEWSALELANHLYTADGLALEELRQVQDEENPLVLPAEEEAPRRTRASVPPTSLDSVLAGMAARREELFEYLSTLPPEVWERPFQHPSWGQLKFYQLVNILPMHDQMHAQQLVAIKEKIG
jgi:DinB superfamily